MTWAQLRAVLIRRSGGLALLIGLTMLRLLTNLGMRPAVATETYLLTMTAIVLGWCAKALMETDSAERPTTARFRRNEFGDRPERLKTLEDKAEYGARTAYATHRALRSDVRSLAVDRLFRVGVDIDTDPRAEALLGATGWWLTRPDLERPKDENARGLSDAQVLDLARTLENLARPDLARPDHDQHSPTGER